MPTNCRCLQLLTSIPLLNETAHTWMQRQPPGLTWPENLVWLNLSKPLKFLEFSLALSTVAKIVVYVMNKILCCARKMTLKRRTCCSIKYIANIIMWNFSNYLRLFGVAAIVFTNQLSNDCVKTSYYGIVTLTEISLKSWSRYCSFKWKFRRLYNICRKFWKQASVSVGVKSLLTRTKAACLTCVRGYGSVCHYRGACGSRYFYARE